MKFLLGKSRDKTLKSPLPNRAAWLITLIYVGISFTWILTSDILLNFIVRDSVIHTQLSVAKGFLFVLVTGLLLFLTLRSLFKLFSRTESGFRTLTNNLKDVVFVFDPGSRKIRYINKAAELTLGYPLERFSDIGFFRSIVFPEYASVLERVSSSKPDYEDSFIIAWRSADGGKVYMEHQISIVPNLQTGNPEIVGVARDISQTLAHLRQLEVAERKQTRLAERLAMLNRIDKMITSLTPLDTLLNIVVNELKQLLDTDAVAILTIRNPEHMLFAMAGEGFTYDEPSAISVHVDRGYAGQALSERKPLDVGDIQAEDSIYSRKELAREEGFHAYAVAPMIVSGSSLGVVEIYRRSSTAFTAETLNYLAAIAEQAAIAIDHLTMVKELQTANELLHNAYDANIRGWSSALDYRDKETEGHSRRVTEITIELSREMGMHDGELKYIRWGALLHDIGKMGIPDRILLKPGSLDEDEWEIIRKHPVIARDLLMPIEFLKSAIDIPYCHHEKWEAADIPGGLRAGIFPIQPEFLPLRISGTPFDRTAPTGREKAK